MRHIYLKNLYIHNVKGIVDQISDADSGPLLGIILYSASMKLFVLGTVLLHIVLPFQTKTIWMNWPLFMIEIVALAIVIGIVESIMARIRMCHIPGLLIAAMLFCGFGFILLMRYSQ